MSMKKREHARIRPGRRLALGALLCVGVVLIFFNGCVTYLAKAGCGQAQILMNREPIEGVLEDPATPEEVREKLRHVEAVRAFAAERLGLESSTTFTSYARIDREAAAWNVTAAPELKLEPKTWWFPIVGRVPYLGYYSEAEAEAEARALEEDGYDAMVGVVPAYSTLGWFDDPLLSSQMQYSKWYLTRLLIHESVHATLWFPGDVGFNESFASFVEKQGALQFVREHYGSESEEYRNVLLALDERRRLAEAFRACADRLRELYADPDATEAEKRGEKARILDEFREKLIRLGGTFRILDLSEYAERDFNNAHFLAYRRYESGQGYFARVYAECDGDWERFFARMHALEELSPAERRALLDGTGGDS